MSAYGTMLRAPRTSYLPSTIWPWPERATLLDSRQGLNPTLSDPSQRNVKFSTISIHHIDEDAVRQGREGLFEYLHSVFANEVDKGMTYPQENVRDRAIFASYFFAADVIVAIAGISGEDVNVGTVVDGPGAQAVKEVDMGLDEARGGRSWEECVIGFYYVRLVHYVKYHYTEPLPLTGKAQLPWAFVTCESIISYYYTAVVGELFQFTAAHHHHYHEHPESMLIDMCNLEASLP